MWEITLLFKKINIHTECVHTVLSLFWIYLQLGYQHNSRGHLIQKEHAAKSIRPAFDSNTIAVTAIMERDITAYRILHTDQNDVWVYDGDETLTLYDEKVVEKKISTFNHLCDMALAASQDIIATNVYNKCLVKISPSGDVSTLCSTAPLQPYGICINNRGNIVAGLDAGLEKPPLTKLAIYSSDGSTVLREIENRESGKPLFTGSIKQVKQNGNRDYVVAGGGRIVCVSSEGRFRWYYNAILQICGIVCDKYDNVIIAEHNKIHLLSSEGKLVTTLLTEEDGISWPESLSIDGHRQLWIGQDKSLKVIRYLK